MEWSEKWKLKREKWKVKSEVKWSEVKWQDGEEAVRKLWFSYMYRCWIQAELTASIASLREGKASKLMLILLRFEDGVVPMLSSMIPLSLLICSKCLRLALQPAPIWSLLFFLSWVYKWEWKVFHSSHLK